MSPLFKFIVIRKFDLSIFHNFGISEKYVCLPYSSITLVYNSTESSKQKNLCYSFEARYLTVNIKKYKGRSEFKLCIKS